MSPANLFTVSVSVSVTCHTKWSRSAWAHALLLHLDLVWHVTVNKLAGDICHFCIKISPFLYVLQTIQTNIRIINNKFEYLVV